MFTDARITLAFEKMLGGIEAPPVPMAEIRQRIAQPQASLRRTTRFYYFAASIAAAAVLVLLLPSVAPGFTQSVEAQVEAILRWKPPPAAPRVVWSAMRSHTGTLAEAQSRVSFTVVPPAGLPADVVSGKIQTAPSGVFSKVTHSWSVGSTNVTFSYRRADGRSFMLMASRFGTAGLPPSKYVFEEMGRMHNGREVVVRRNAYAWRNGDQVMGAIQGEGISDAEIAAIRTAMHGVIVRSAWPPREGPLIEQYRIPEP